MCILRCELLEAVQVDHDVFLIVMTCFLQTQVSCTGPRTGYPLLPGAMQQGAGKHVYRLDWNPKINVYRLKGNPKRDGTLRTLEYQGH